MYKINFPRIGFDHIFRPESTLLDQFVDSIKPEIEKNLKDLKSDSTLRGFHIMVIDILLCRLDRILRMRPDEMDWLKGKKSLLDELFRSETIDNKGKHHPCESYFCKKILAAFNYENFRYSRLVEHGKRLNLKSCPYCNHSYTLVIEEKGSHKARFQFDHFFSKSHYPFLSMSFYNLIPSCPVCNQGKSSTACDIKFNPYHSNIDDIFSFEVTSPFNLLSGGLVTDKNKVVLKAKKGFTDADVASYDRQFKIKATYSRHSDILQEISDKVYLDRYYSEIENFESFLGKGDGFRLLAGVYPNRSEIEKRPLSKYVLDLWEQLR